MGRKIASLHSEVVTRKEDVDKSSLINQYGYASSMGAYPFLETPRVSCIMTAMGQRAEIIQCHILSLFVLGISEASSGCTLIAFIIGKWYIYQRN